MLCFHFKMPRTDASTKQEWVISFFELWAGSSRSFTPKSLQPVLHSSPKAQPISWLIWRTAFPRPFHACIMSCKQDPDEERHLRKRKVMLIRSYARIRHPLPPHAPLCRLCHRRNQTLPIHHRNHLIIWLVSHNVIDEIQFSTWSAWKKNKQYINCLSNITPFYTL